MATAQIYSYPSSPAATPPAPETRMAEYPELLTATQREARSILRSLLETIKEPDSEYYERYGNWVARHPKLDDFCFRCVRTNVWRFLDGRWSLDALKFIGGDLRHEGRGIYFDGVLGLDKNIRLYVGQSTNIRFRIAQHLNFRYRRDNPSLHYHAIHKSIFNVLGILAIVPPNSIGNHALPGMDCPDLLLNLLEMWMCLVFRCLPQQTLNTWLPQDVGRSSNFGALNIASPLDSGSDEREWVDLSQWNDPLVQEYLGMSRRKTYTKWTKEEEEEEQLEEEPKREVVGRESKQVVSEHNVIQISTPTLVLVGAAVLTGFLLLRSGIGPERR